MLFADGSCSGWMLREGAMGAVVQAVKSLFWEENKTAIEGLL